MTVSEFIDALGGTTATAALFQVGPSAVSNWKAADRFPDRLHLKAARIAEERGLAFDPSPRTPAEAA